MPTSSRLAFLFAKAGPLAAVALLTGCVGVQQALPTDPPGRLFARGLDDIQEFYIAPVSNRMLAISGAERLPTLDRRISVAETPGPGSETDIVLDYARREVAVLPEPASGDAHAWGALLGRLVARARSDSPSFANLSADRVETAVFDGIAGGLDRFSRYASPSAARDQRARRDGFGGIGVTIEIAGGTVRVSAVTAGSPADQSGVRVGDRIVAIDGVTIPGRSQTDIIGRLRGPVATTVEISVVPAGAAAPRDLRIGRALITPPTVHMTRDGDVAVFRLAGFNQDTTRQLVQDLAATLRSRQPPLRGVVLDLRGDPGGLLDQAVSLADVFVAGGPIAATAGRHPASRQLFEASGGSLAPHLPVVVLVDGRSASASEVVAAALQDRGRAVVVGTASYGKGTVQTIIRLPNGGELTLTWALLLAPSGYLLNAHGVVPTVCTSDLGNDADALAVALARAGAASSSSLRQQRALLSEAEWARLRRACPSRPGDPAIDMTVAKALLADPPLFAQALAALAPSPKLAAGGAAAAGPGLTGGPGSLLSRTHAP